MKTVKISIDEYVYRFYQKIGICAGGIEPEKVIADCLLKFAGGLSALALQTNAKDNVFNNSEQDIK